MKIWYKAVCDEHKEMCDCMVDNPRRTAIYLADLYGDINAWLQLHSPCRLRLIRHDHELDECFEKGYTNVCLSKDDPAEYEQWVDEIFGPIVRKHKSQFNTSNDGYFLSHVVPANTIERTIDIAALGITEDAVRQEARQSSKITIDSSAEEKERWYIMQMMSPYSMPKDGDVFVWYNDIRVLSGTAGYLWLRDGYVIGRKIVLMS